MTAQSPQLTWDVFVTPAIPSLGEMRGFSPISATLIAGHQRAGRHDGPEILEETRQYIRDFDRLTATTTTAEDLYNRMLALYPERVNPDALWISAHAMFALPGTE